MSNIKTPSKTSKPRDDELECTPKKTPKTETVCSIVNVSDIILSPSKTPGRDDTNWFEFGISTPNSTRLQRVGCFSKQWHEFLNSEAVRPIINNPHKTIVINNIVNGDKGLSMGNKSSFGRIADIKIPFSFERKLLTEPYHLINRFLDKEVFRSSHVYREY